MMALSQSFIFKAADPTFIPVCEPWCYRKPMTAMLTHCCRHFFQFMLLHSTFITSVRAFAARAQYCRTKRSPAFERSVEFTMWARYLAGRQILPSGRPTPLTQMLPCCACQCQQLSGLSPELVLLSLTPVSSPKYSAQNL